MQKEISLLKRELEGIPIIVEGINDKKPLNKLGFTGIHMVAGKTASDIVNEIPPEHKTVLILTDFDKEGEEKAKILARMFNGVGIKTLANIRNYFHSQFKVTKIEELNTLAKVIEEGISTKLIRRKNYNKPISLMVV